MFIELIKGNFYQRGKAIFLVGGNVPCIPNRWVSRVYSDGRLGEPQALYYRQPAEYWSLSGRDIKFDKKYKRTLIVLFCNDFHQTRPDRYPDVSDYLKENKSLTSKLKR